MLWISFTVILNIPGRARTRLRWVRYHFMHLHVSKNKCLFKIYTLHTSRVLPLSQSLFWKRRYTWAFHFLKKLPDFLLFTNSLWYLWFLKTFEHHSSSFLFLVSKSFISLLPRKLKPDPPLTKTFDLNLTFHHNLFPHSPLLHSIYAKK